MTRFEKLKEMSIEEVAEWLVDNTSCNLCPIYDECVGKVTLDDCKKAMRRFLNDEVPDENEVCGSCSIDF